MEGSQRQAAQGQIKRQSKKGLQAEACNPFVSPCFPSTTNSTESSWMLLGGATQPLIGWWESGRYMPGERYLGGTNQFLAFDPMALNVYIRAIGLQPPRRRRQR